MSNCPVCGNGIATHSKRTLCDDCRRYLGRWRSESYGVVKKYSNKLGLRLKRLGIVSDIPKKGAIEPRKKEEPNASNVVQLRRKA
jgi:hypothetical protein